MITILAKKYRNDYSNQMCTMRFSSLTDLFEHLVKISLDFADKKRSWIPVPSEGKQYDWCSRIEIDNKTDYLDCFWIYKIENENGILYSNGTYTDGEKFCAKSVEDWLVKCKQYINKKNRFVEE